MGIKFRVFIFPKDFYSQAFSFMIFLQLQKKAKISISKVTVVWKKQVGEKAGSDKYFWQNLSLGR